MIFDKDIIDRINVIRIETYFRDGFRKQVLLFFMYLAIYELNQLDRWRFNSLRTVQISDPCFAICSTKHFIGFFAFHENFSLKRKTKDVSVESNRAIQIRNC